MSRDNERKHRKKYRHPETCMFLGSLWIIAASTPSFGGWLHTLVGADGSEFYGVKLVNVPAKVINDHQGPANDDQLLTEYRR